MNIKNTFDTLLNSKTKINKNTISYDIINVLASCNNRTIWIICYDFEKQLKALSVGNKIRI